MKSPEVTLIVCSYRGNPAGGRFGGHRHPILSTGCAAEPFPSPYTRQVRLGSHPRLRADPRAVVRCVLWAALLGFVGIVGWVVLIFVLIEGSRKYRATQQHGLLWLLTVSAERDMPLIPAMEAFARERGGSFSRRAKRLAGMLKAGVPLPDALDRCPGLLPRYAAPTIRVGYETGTLGPGPAPGGHGSRPGRADVDGPARRRSLTCCCCRPSGACC